MCAPVILGVDASPVFEPVEHILDFVTLAVECFVGAGRQFSSLSWRDTRGDANCLQGSAILVTVISLVPDHTGGVVWERGISQLCTDMVAHLAFAHAQDQRPSITVTHSVQLGVQPAFSTPDTSGKRPF